MKLLKEKPLSKITVKEICDLAEINRGTFYKHYTDVYDLMEQLENSALEHFEQLLLSAQDNDSISVLTSFLTSLREYKEFIEPLTVRSSSSDFMNRLSDTCAQYALSHLNSANNDFTANTKKQYVYSYLAGGTSSLITHWLQTGAKESPQQLANMIECMNSTILSLPQ